MIERAMNSFVKAIWVFNLKMLILTFSFIKFIYSECTVYLNGSELWFGKKFQ